ncbi:hypothetical protein IJ596_05145 [bacterium]|nr:hypothetical protein [bacterium]
MLSTGMNYGLGTTGMSSPKDILTNAYANPMTTCSATGSINVNGAVLPTNYDNDFLMPEELKIGNYLNGQASMQGNPYQTTQTGDQFVSSQTPVPQQQDYYQQTQMQNPEQAQAEVQEQEQDAASKKGFSLKTKAGILGFAAPVLACAYKVLKGAKASTVFNKELLVKCPILAAVGFVVGGLAEKFFGNKAAA